MICDSPSSNKQSFEEFPYKMGGCHGLNRMVVEFTTTCAISAYYHFSCEFVLDTTLCDKDCQ